MRLFTKDLEARMNEERAQLKTGCSAATFKRNLAYVSEKLAMTYARGGRELVDYLECIAGLGKNYAKVAQQVDARLVQISYLHSATATPSTVRRTFVQTARRSRERVLTLCARMFLWKEIVDQGTADQTLSRRAERSLGLESKETREWYDVVSTYHRLIYAHDHGFENAEVRMWQYLAQLDLSSN